MLILPIYTGDNNANPAFVLPKMQATTMLRTFAGDGLKPLNETLGGNVGTTGTAKVLCDFNRAPAKALNKLFGSIIYRSIFETVLVKARHTKEHAAIALTSYLIDGGLRSSHFQNGPRLPYLAADGRLHALCVMANT